MSERGGRPPRRGGNGGGGGRGGGDRGRGRGGGSHNNHHNGHGHNPHHQPQSQQPQQTSKKEVEQRQQALKKEQAETASKAAGNADEAEFAKPLEAAMRYFKNELNELKPRKAFAPSWVPQRGAVPEFRPEDNPREGQTLLEEQHSDPFYAVWADALSSLLSAPHHVFWSTLIYDESLRRFLDSFLRFFVRPEESVFAVAVLKSQNVARKQVFEGVFRVYWRASQRTEPRPGGGAALFMEQAYYTKLISDSVFDIPRLFDLASLYGRVCPEQVRAVLHTACSASPRTAETLFDSGILLTEGLEKLEATVKREKDAEKLLDSQGYLLDLSATLNRFVSLYYPAAAPLAKCGLIARLAHVIPVLCMAVGPAARRKELDRGVLRLAITLINGHYFTLLSSGEVNQHKALFEELTNVLVACAHVPSDQSGPNAANFIEGIDEAYQLRSRLAALTTTTDSARRKYLLATLDERCGAKPRAPLPSAPPAAPGAKSKAAGSSPAPAKAVQPNKALAQVQELFPDHSAEFILRCLAAFDNSADRTINALLENNLPPGLSQDTAPPVTSAVAVVSTSVQLVAPAPASPSIMAIPPPTVARRNVYDAQAPVDARLGKKDRTAEEESESARKDKEHLKEFVRNYEWTYDDEADDSLDAFGSAVADRTADEALTASRARAARVRAAKPDEEEEEEEFPSNPNHLGSDDEDEEGEEGEGEEGTGKPPAAGAGNKKPAAKPELSSRGRRNKEKRGGSGHSRKDGAARKMNRAMGFRP